MIARKKRHNVYEDLVVASNPKSAFAEAIKSVKTNVLFSSVDKELKTILVTSPDSGDGKSFTIANLAAAFGQDSKKVLIIDGDLRRGRQHEIFNIPNHVTEGYSNAILRYRDAESYNMIGFINLNAYIKETPVKNVYLLPTGPNPPNPLELLSSMSNKRIIERLKTQFDIILIDCPPVLGLSDALVMSKYSDANIVVVSDNSTKVDQLEDVRENFEKVNSKITGVIINKANFKGSSYSSYYTDKYYTDSTRKKK